MGERTHTPGQDGDGLREVAALFVETNGAYAGFPGVDLWDKARDARLYAGPYPVVAHPPCQRWGSMAFVNHARWGGDHNRPGNDEGCFKSALYDVRRWGGVLEHPAKSRAWDAYGLTKPAAIGWQRCLTGGWVCEVWQSAYGHRANKATWLYYFGEVLPPELRWARPVGTHQVGFHDQRGPARNKPTLSKKEANATPVEFRDALIAIARSATPLRRGGSTIALRLIPADPTPGMVVKGGFALCAAQRTAETYADEAEACYRAMLDAAPVLAKASPHV